METTLCYRLFLSKRRALSDCIFLSKKALFTSGANYCDFCVYLNANERLHLDDTDSICRAVEDVSSWFGKLPIRNRTQSTSKCLRENRFVQEIYNTVITAIVE